MTMKLNETNVMEARNFNKDKYLCGKPHIILVGNIRQWRWNNAEVLWVNQMTWKLGIFNKDKHPCGKRQIILVGNIPDMEFFLVRIFLYSDIIRRFTE